MTVLAAITFAGASSLAAPKDPSQFTVQEGGFADIPLGSYIQGSTEHGGMQPDYHLDPEGPELQAFLHEVRQMARTHKRSQGPGQTHAPPQSSWNLDTELIAKISDLVRKHLPTTDYESSEYLTLLANYELSGEDITLDPYLKIMAGVCREYALLTHIALKAAGIPNEFAYVWVLLDNVVWEDHAFVVVKEKGERWIIDPYSDHFNGRSLAEAMSPSAAVTRISSPAPWARNPVGHGQVVRINDYPRLWLAPTAPASANRPRRARASRCEAAFL